MLVTEEDEMTATDNANTGSSTPTPHDYDKSTGDKVEKKPQGEKSPQQEHDNEDHG